MPYTSTEVAFDELPLSQNVHAYAFATGMLTIKVDEDGDWTWGLIELQAGWDHDEKRALFDRFEETDALFPVLILALERENKRTGFIDDAAWAAVEDQRAYIRDQYADLRRDKHAEV